MGCIGSRNRQSKGRVDVSTKPRCIFRKKVRKERLGVGDEERRLFGVKEQVIPHPSIFSCQIVLLLPRNTRNSQLFHLPSEGNPSFVVCPPPPIMQKAHLLGPRLISLAGSQCGS